MGNKSQLRLSAPRKKRRKIILEYLKRRKLNENRVDNSESVFPLNNDDGGVTHGNADKNKKESCISVVSTEDQEEEINTLNFDRKVEINVKSYPEAKRKRVKCQNLDNWNAKRKIKNNLDEEETNCNSANPNTSRHKTQLEKVSDKYYSLPFETSEPNQKEIKCITLEGRRIVDIGYMFKCIKDTGVHHPFGCTFIDMVPIKEDKNAFFSNFTFKCEMCFKIVKISTNSPENLSPNVEAVSGIVSTGGGFSQLEELTSVLNIPTISKPTFLKVHTKVAEIYNDTAWKAMEEAGREEAALARAAGDVNTDNVPIIAVVADGAWSKRSYRTNYNASSGAACIIGYRTKKVLFLGVRNKYCSFCARYLSQSKEVPQHICYRNWSKSSTSMEADIIVVGFRTSVETHNLIYGRLIGDGDSSVHRKLMDTMPYGPLLPVEKIECRNHLLRNYSSRLNDIVTKSKLGSVFERNEIRKRLLRLRIAVQKAILFRHKQNNTLLHCTSELKKDILNSPYHIFGDHGKCLERGYFCDGTMKEGEKNWIPDLVECGLFREIMSAVNLVAHHAPSLIHNVCNNPAEVYNSVLAKLIGGKRVNYSQRGSYQARCQAAVTSLNTKQLHRNVHKSIMQRSPGLYTKKFIAKKKCQNKRKTQKQSRRKLQYNTVGPDDDYGPDAAKLPDLATEELEKKKEEFLKILTLSSDKRLEMTTNTVLQSQSRLWQHERRKRITASMVGKICKLRKTTLRAKTVQAMLYSEFSGTSATRYGIEKESFGIEEVEHRLNISIQRTGLWIDKEKPYLGATPDGLIEENGIVEIKCPANVANATPQEAIEKNIVKFCKLIDGDMFLKPDHQYMYQVQTQLHVTCREYCVFVFWTPLGMLLQKIHVDHNFWETKIKAKIHIFYMECLLNELVDPRHPRGLKIREPVTLL